MLALKLVSANLARTVPLNIFLSLTGAVLVAGTMSKQLGCGTGVAVGVGLGSGVAVAVGVGIGVTVGDSVGVAVGVSVGVGEVVGVIVGVSVGVAVGVGSRPGCWADAGPLADASTAIAAIITANAINGRTFASLSCARFFG
jgi:hypothetical protein